jgi:hypothetical protein
MKPTHKIILSILAAAEGPINYRQVFDRMEPSEKGKFDGLKGCNGVVSYMGSKGWAESVPAVEIGDSSFYWVITEAGLKTLKEADAEQTNAEIAVDSNVVQIKEHDSIPNPNQVNEVELDLIAEFDNATSMFRQILVNKTALKPAPSIENKAAKIQVLKHVAGFVKPINEDFERALNDIIIDLERLDEAA